MFKVEVGKGPLMFMPYARIVKEITDKDKVEELNNVFYAILYDFGIPIGCGRLKFDEKTYTIDNIMIIQKFNTPELRNDIKTQLLKKVRIIGLQEETK